MSQYRFRWCAVRRRTSGLHIVNDAVSDQTSDGELFSIILHTLVV